MKMTRRLVQKEETRYAPRLDDDSASEVSLSSLGAISVGKNRARRAFPENYREEEGAERARHRQVEGGSENATPSRGFSIKRPVHLPNSNHDVAAGSLNCIPTHSHFYQYTTISIFYLTVY